MDWDSPEPWVKTNLYLMVLPAILLQQQNEASREDLYMEMALLLDTHGHVCS